MREMNIKRKIKKDVKSLHKKAKKIKSDNFSWEILKGQIDNAMKDKYRHMGGPILFFADCKMQIFVNKSKCLPVKCYAKVKLILIDKQCI